MASNHKRHPSAPRSVNDVDDPTESSAAETGAPPAEARRHGEGLNITDLKDMSIQKLTQIAKDLNVAGATGMRKQDLIFQIL
jgi:transcription termination factor Rho